MTISQERSITDGEQAVYDKEALVLREIKKSLRWKLWRIKAKARRTHKGDRNIEYVKLPSSTDHISGQILDRLATDFMLSKGINVKCITYPSRGNGVQQDSDNHRLGLCRHLIVLKA